MKYLAIERYDLTFKLDLQAKKIMHKIFRITLAIFKNLKKSYYTIFNLK